MKRFSPKLNFPFLIYLFLGMLFLLIACNRPAFEKTPENSATEVLPFTSTESLVTSTTPDVLKEAGIITEMTDIQTPVNTTTALTYTPTPRIFKSGNCSDDVAGTIFFLLENTAKNRNHASNYDLYVMDGNGCSPRFVMSEASGSPAWSTDGKRLAIGCENNAFLCILDVKATLKTCEANGARETGSCSAVILQKVELPPAIGGDQLLYNLTWSPDGSKIAAEGGSDAKHQYLVYIIPITGNDTGKVFIQGLSQLNIAWSTKAEQWALSGLSFINLQSPLSGLSGFNPEWSHDGKRIIFVKSSNHDDKEPYGIASLDLESGNWKWLYETKLRDQNYPPHDVIIDDDNSHRLLSWSPDERYIAFVSKSIGYHSDIFRLNVITGEVVNLTANLKTKEDRPGYSYAPVWEP